MGNSKTTSKQPKKVTDEQRAYVSECFDYYHEGITRRFIPLDIVVGTIKLEPPGQYELMLIHVDQAFDADKKYGGVCMQTRKYYKDVRDPYQYYPHILNFDS